MSRIRDLFKNSRHDVPSGIVVFFVALPLCLAIAQVSTGRPELVFSGIIAGIIGGIIVGSLSGSALGISGPAAGLVVIVSDAIAGLSRDGDYLSGFKAFLLAVCIAGVIQVLAGYLKAGVIGQYFPSSVIKGMLAAIGITIILKEFPHAMGYDKDFMGDEAFEQKDGHNTFTELYYAMRYSSPGAVVIAVLSLGLLVGIEKTRLSRAKIFRIFPSALFVVVIATLANIFMVYFIPSWQLGGEHLVQLPVAASAREFTSFFTLPDFTQLGNPEIYKIAATIAIIASLETLLSLEATDKLDPLKRKSPGNRELKAQGVGNFLSGLLGGLPVTQVVVRSSANINAGAKSRLSAIVHGSILLIAAALVPGYINFVPLACLASILILIGYKLADLSLFRKMYQIGWNQFIPFIVTIIAILATDLLRGIVIGMICACFYIIRANYRTTFRLRSKKQGPGEAIYLELSEQMTFVNKDVVTTALQAVPANSKLVLDGRRNKYMDHDVLEAIHDFIEHRAKDLHIEVECVNIPARIGQGR